MRILVDADACPIKNIILEESKKYNISVYMYFDNSHIYNDEYSKVIIVDKSKDSVDLKIINDLHKDDIVVTQDYGLASIVISKNAKAISNNGLIFTKANIDRLLFERFLGIKNRKAKIKTKKMKKRDKIMDDNFRKNFLKLIKL